MPPPPSATYERLRAFIAERMLRIAEHVRNSMLGRGQRTDGDQILITNRSEAAP
jgi:hypothetical protein